MSNCWARLSWLVRRPFRRVAMNLARRLAGLRHLAKVVLEVLEAHRLPVRATREALPAPLEAGEWEVARRFASKEQSAIAMST